jgi:class 3 adenylate cyclase
MEERLETSGDAPGSIPDDLRGHGLRGRFPTEIERQYRLWLVEQVRSVAVVLGLLAIAAWVVIPIGFVVTDNRSQRHALLYALSWGVIIPVIVAAMHYTRRATRGVVPVVAAALFVVGTINLFLFALSLPDTAADGYMLCTAFYCMLAPALRLSARTTFALALPLTVVGEVTAAAAAAGPWERIFIGQNITLPSVTLLIVPGIALSTERAMRARFVGERVIERQQQRLTEFGTVIRRYAPSAVARRVERGDLTVDQPVRRRVTVLFSDVVGFTVLADRIDPEALAQIVNDYLGSLAEIIERHGGTVNEFSGDGMMALFGAPEELAPDEQVRAALAAGRELQAALPAWSRAWYQHGITEDLQARVGINTGIVSVGTFGSAVRATYTGIGLQTNIAARIQAQAKPGTVLLSSTSWHLIKDTVPCVSRGPVDVKGVHFPIEIYEPCG